MHTKSAKTFEAIIIGSGYGGSVAAARLSEMGIKTLLIERGKEYKAGEFPETRKEVSNSLTLKANQNKKPDKLFQFHLDDNAPVLVGSGLGGTSLINANIGMVPEDYIFQKPEWPEVFQHEKGIKGSLLEVGYEKARAMLQPNITTNEDVICKTHSLKEVAKGMNNEFNLTENYVNYADKPFINQHGIGQNPCTHCGNCITGCNVGAKNTLNMNYIPFAKNNGCTIVTETLVDHFEENNGTWKIHCTKYDDGKIVNKNSTYEAKFLFIAAGSLGSTRLLLESQNHGLKLSKKIGTQYSGNGDFLGLAYNSKRKVNGVGIVPNHKLTEDYPGACITSVMKRRGNDTQKDYIVQDAVIPMALADILPLALRISDEENLQDIEQGEDINNKQLIRKHISKEDGPYTGAVQNTLTFLVMSDDGAKGQLKFKGDKLIIDWEGIEESEHFKYINGELKKATDVIDADYIPSPLYELDKLKIFKKKVISVHPLGGCPMGEDGKDGVVNHKGQVFKGENTEVYPNLFITDGAIVPSALAVNPSLTITALSERILEIFKQEQHLESNMKGATTKHTERLSERPGVEFSETMRGKFVEDGLEIDFNQKFVPYSVKKGRKFTLTAKIESSDYKKLLSITDLDHYAQLSGHIDCPEISKYPILFENGTFELFRPQTESLFDYRMIYSFTTIPISNGDQYRFVGQKFVKDDDFGNAITDTTTLYFNLYKKPKGQSEVPYGRGIIKIKLLDLIKQYFTIKGTNVDTKRESKRIKRAFLAGFSSDLIKIYGKFIAPDKLPIYTDTHPKRSLICDHRKSVHNFTTSDHHKLRLTRYENKGQGRVLLVHPFNCSSDFFSVDTIKTNLVEHFWKQGLDVWLLDYRLSCLLPYDEEQTDLDTIANIDIPEAINKIKEIGGDQPLQIVAHCVGSIVVQLATMYNNISPQALHLFSVGHLPQGTRAVNFKSKARLANILNFFGVRYLNSSTKKGDSFGKKLFSRFTKIYAYLGGEGTNNPVLNRNVFMFGGMISEDTINQATSDIMVELFGAANMRTFLQLTDAIRTKHLVDARGNKVENLEALNIPIHYYQGDKNGVFKKSNTLNACKKLSKKHPKTEYTHHYFKNYGHIDPILGKNAIKDVYPTVTANIISKVPSKQE